MTIVTRKAVTARSVCPARHCAECSAQSSRAAASLGARSHYSRNCGGRFGRAGSGWELERAGKGAGSGPGQPAKGARPPCSPLPRGVTNRPRVVGSPGLWLVPFEGGCLGPLLDAPGTTSSPKCTFRRRPWAALSLFSPFLMSLSRLNRILQHNHASVTALTARTRGCGWVCREGGEVTGKALAQRGWRPPPGPVRTQTREGWGCGVSSRRPGRRPRHSPRAGQRGRAVWVLCGQGPWVGGATPLLPALRVQPWRLALLVRTPVQAGVRSVTSSKALALDTVASWARGGRGSNRRI